MLDDIGQDHPCVWWDDDYAECWWGQGHLSLEQMEAGAKLYDEHFDLKDRPSAMVKHLWRSNCGPQDGFSVSEQHSDAFPHPITKLVSCNTK